MIDRIIQGKKIGELNLSDIKQKIEESGEPESIIKARLKNLEHAVSLNLPGKPDELWRRINLRNLNLKDYSIDKPIVEVEYACEKDQNTEQFYIRSIEETMEDNPKLFDKFYEKLEQAKEIAEKNKDTVYSSDIDETVFMSLTESLFNSGIFIYAPRFTNIESPVKIKITSEKDKSVTLPKMFIYMEEGSKVDIVFDCSSKANEEVLSLGMVNGVIEDGAKLNIVSYQDFNSNTTAIHSKYFAIGKDAGLSYDFIQMGSKTSIIQHNHSLIDAGAEVYMNGIVRTIEDQLIANKLGIHHYSPNTFSDFKSKSVLRDRSKVVFLGNIKMPQIAQKSNGHQSADNLILGEESEAEVIPRLEIIADDVKCSHGATAGSIDKETLFYLTSRGIDKDEAENMIIKGYYQDILNNMSVLKKHCCVYEYITEKLTNKLGLEFDAFTQCSEKVSDFDF